MQTVGPGISQWAISMGTRLGYTSELKQTELADGLKTEGKGKEGIKTNS